jgi:hypothetical protein
MKSRHSGNRKEGREAPQTTVLGGRKLFVARAACLVLAALTLGLFFASVPAAYARWATLCEGAGCDVPQLSREAVKALERLDLSVGVYVTYIVALRIAIALGYWATGALLFWQKSADRLALYASIALVAFGTIQADTLYTLVDAHPVWRFPIDFVYFVGEAAFFVLFCVFPDGRFVPRWTRWVAVVWAAYWLLNTFFPDLPFVGPGNWVPLVNFSLFVALIGSLVAAQIYRYRRVSTRKQRQQTKWVVYGLAAAITATAFIVLLSLGWIFPLPESGIPKVIFDLLVATGITVAALLIPSSIGVAILRYQLWDIDLIIKRSLVYGFLTTVLAGLFAITDTLLLPLLVRSILGKEDAALNAVVSAVIIAVLFEPLRRLIKVGVNRLSDWLARVDMEGESQR